eukprot:2080120-Pyramimonas_sp.AAC.1
MSSAFLKTDISLTRLGSGRRMTEIVRQLPMPRERPSQARVSGQEFVRAGRPFPAGDARVLHFFLLLILASALAATARGLARSR